MIALPTTQWLERTLDDSAGRRISLPESFLTADAILRLLTNVARGLTVNAAVVSARLNRELPFMATEEILMRAVKAGGDRQDLHERLQADDAFAAVREDLDDLLRPERFVGRAPEQVETFTREHVDPALTPWREQLGAGVELRI